MNPPDGFAARLLKRAIAFVVVFAAVYGIVIMLVREAQRADPAIVALYIVIGLGLLVGGAFGMLKLMMWMMTTLPTLGKHADYMAPAIEGQYREIARAPAPQLPARTITVPRYYEHGVSRPMVHLQTQTEGGETLTVPLSRLTRFLALPTPSRAEWTGDRSAYGDCLEFCLEHGLLDRTTKGGVTWRAQYPLAKRSEWAAQWMVEDENN